MPACTRTLSAEVEEKVNGCRRLLVNPSLLIWSDDKKTELVGIVPEWDLILYPGPEELAVRMPKVEVVFGKIQTELLAEARSLRWLQLQGAGADRFVKALKGTDVLITNASGVHSIPITEHILALMLSLARDIPKAIRGQLKGEWYPHAKHAVFELSGKRVVLIGTGAIGGHFARAAAALGMEVVGVRKRPEWAGDGMIRVVGPGRLREELPEADFVVLAAPLTAETMGILGREELALMNSDSYVINIGRGKLMDQNALVESLLNGSIAGAGLDVFEEEPLPEVSPLWNMENVVVTSHYAGLSPKYSERLWSIFIENLKRYLTGEDLVNRIDMVLGY